MLGVVVRGRRRRVICVRRTRVTGRVTVGRRRHGVICRRWCLVRARVCEQCVCTFMHTVLPSPPTVVSVASGTRLRRTRSKTTYASCVRRVHSLS
jgi:hypothetical protein